MSYPPPPGQSGYPAPPPYGQPAAKTKLRGGLLWRLSIVFLVLAVAAFVAGGIVLAKKSLGKVDDFQRVSIANGSGTVDLSGTGKWVGYYEADGVDSSITRIPDFTVAIADPSGQPVKIEHYGNRSDGNVDKVTYGYHGHNGAAAFQFDAKRSGKYAVQLEGNDQIPSGADIAIGRDIKGGTIVGALLIVAGVILLIVAIVLLIVGLVKRGRHKRELSNPYGGGGGGAGGYGYPPPPGYQQQGYQQPGYPPQPGYQQQPPPQPGYQSPGQPPSAQPEGYWTKPPS